MLIPPRCTPPPFSFRSGRVSVRYAVFPLPHIRQDPSQRSEFHMTAILLRRNLL